MNRIRSMVVAGFAVVALSLASGCCHRAMHRDAGCGCRQQPRCCNAQPPCTAGAPAQQAGKPCCANQPAPVEQQK